MRIDFCNHKVGSNEPMLVYGANCFCIKCIDKLLKKYQALPNDGSIFGGWLAMKLSDNPKEVLTRLQEEQ